MTGYLKIEFPANKLKIREEGGQKEVFDPVRKYWVALTPEEWVRQNFIQFLLSEEYPANLLAVEKKVFLGELTKRCDIVVYTRASNPFMIVECKQMNVPLTPKVLDQVLRYHITLHTRFLVITNGSYTLAFSCETGRLVPLKEFPEYPKNV